jgi:hypothetical protein
MLTTRHQVDFADTTAELDALFRYAQEHDVNKGATTMPGARPSMCGRITGYTGGSESHEDQ